MLVLSRLTGESLVINGRIRVTVAGLSHDQVSLWIEVPADVGGGPPVDRRRITLRQDERHTLTDSILMTMVEIRIDRARIGITAPPEVPIYREEIWLAMNKDAAPPGARDAHGADAASRSGPAAE